MTRGRVIACLLALLLAAAGIITATLTVDSSRRQVCDRLDAQVRYTGHGRFLCTQNGRVVGP